MLWQRVETRSLRVGSRSEENTVDDKTARVRSDSR